MDEMEIDLRDGTSQYPSISQSELKERRERLGLSMAELAKAMRLSYDTIYSYERRGERGIPSHIVPLLEYLELKEALRSRRSAEIKIDQLLN